MKDNFCIRCGSQITTQARFCPNCGRKLKSEKLHLSSSGLISLVVGALAVSAVVYVINGEVIGKEPKAGQFAKSQTPLEATPDDTVEEDKETQDLRAEVAKNPKNIELKRKLAEKFWNVVSTPSDQPPPSKIVLDLLDLLGEILKEEPGDRSALLMMANLSFNQKVFDKSAQYYQTYLKMDPSNFEARASYASALTFTGKMDDALRELDVVLKANPTYFQGLAYKSIALAQMGKMAEAIAIGQEALKNAPSDEARERLAKFIDSLSNDDSGHMGGQKPLVRSTEALLGNDPVTNFLKTHPISGPKMVSSQRMDLHTVKIVFKDFPIDKIPPAMKESFFTKIKQAAGADKDLSTIIFIDADTGAEMTTISVSH